MRLITAALASALCAAAMPATAQDAMDWTGFYAGVGIGGQQTGFVPESTTANITISINTNNQTAGSGASIPPWQDLTRVTTPAAQLIAGYGAQLGNAYLGVEGELDLLGPVSSPTSSPLADCSLYNVCGNLLMVDRVDSLGRIRGLFGVVLDPRVMVFAAGGAAFATSSVLVSAHADVDGGTSVDDMMSDSRLMVAPSIGGGVEVKATDNLRLRLEGSMESFGLFSSGTLNAAAAAAGGGGSFSGTISGSSAFSASVVSARLAALWQF